MDQSQGIRATIRTLVQNGLFGILLVGLVVLAFLRSVRSTALVLIAIPIGLLGAGIGMFFTGNTLNSMTLGGLALSVGVLVDQAIVVTENISRHLRMGKTRAQAALDLALLRVEEGAGLLLEALEADLDLSRARRSLVRAVGDFNRAQYALLRAVGGAD